MSIAFYAATKLEMVVNLKTAKALGLAVSPSISRPVLEVLREAPARQRAPVDKEGA